MYEEKGDEAEEMSEKTPVESDGSESEKGPRAQEHYPAARLSRM